MNAISSRRGLDAANEFNARLNSEYELENDLLLFTQIGERARSAWPGVSVDMAAFAHWALTSVNRAPRTDEWLRAIVIEDLFLAYACSRGDPNALKAFEGECESELRWVANRLRICRSELEDLRQKLWVKLFLRSEGAQPKILQYGGRGRLRHWFRVLAVRSALNDLKRLKHESAEMTPSVRSMGTVIQEHDPELASMLVQCKAAFGAAFEKAVRSLNPEQRNLLKCHYTVGMSTDQLAKAFGLPKSTTARRVAKARDELLERTRSALRSSLGSDGNDLDSVMRLLEGHMSISFSRLL